MSRRLSPAAFALVVLASVNLFNYIDRWMLAALVESVKAELHLSDTQLGLIASAFIVIYTASSPIFGTMGDRSARPPLVAFGVFVQSIAAVATGLARGFWGMFFSRASVGVGEAAYGTVAPALLADHFAIGKRGRVLAAFFAAIPIGSAAGYVLGGMIDHHFGWRAAWFAAGIPGIFLTLIVLKVADPPRGASDHRPPAAVTAGAPWYRAWLRLMKNGRFVLSVLGYAAYTFGIGGLAFWMPAFLERARGMPRQSATVTFGAIALVTGFLGTFVGGWLGDKLLPRTRQSYLWVSGIATLLAAPLTWLAVAHPSASVYLPAIVLGEVLIFMCTGPVNSAIINAVSPAERSTALGLSVFLMHILGDIPSPPLIGAISDASSIERGLLLVPFASLLAGVIWTVAAVRFRDAEV
jgi:MFS family permease